MCVYRCMCTYIYMYVFMCNYIDVCMHIYAMGVGSLGSKLMKTLCSCQNETKVPKQSDK